MALLVYLQHQRLPTMALLVYLQHQRHLLLVAHLELVDLVELGGGGAPEADLIRSAVF